MGATKVGGGEVKEVKEAGRVGVAMGATKVGVGEVKEAGTVGVAMAAIEAMEGRGVGEAAARGSA